MHHLRKQFVILCLCLLASTLPFLILGESFENEIRSWFEQSWSPPARFGLIVALLALDIFLPIPSSAVSTYGGAVLGFGWATLASWLGLMLGNLVGFHSAKFVGARFVQRMTDQRDRQVVDQVQERLAIWSVAVTRPLPILAEATILLFGAMRVPFSLILFPLIVANLVIAASYSAIGALAIQYDVTVWVIIGSVVFPVALTWLVRKHLDPGVLSHPQALEDSHASRSGH
ncbi:SNARE associated Golgi protein [Thalassoglobus neptunius]|uniref:SNARE associated Golgi protein n=1 Tax=Thalassoglobus neptunius TaxID=1938619 RepID=A0A5C5X8K2_9PLAN|nr:VTT domain-containing protein [Thalassoglobus neptunius]TWT58202.1 SNARE associated Golgi protein [Thalassoglobus neptunius]